MKTVLQYAMFISCLLLWSCTLREESRMVPALPETVQTSKNPLQVPSTETVCEVEKIQAIDFDQEGMLWIAYPNKVSRLNLSQKMFVDYNIKDITTLMYDIKVREKNTPWIATKDGVWEFKDNSWKQYLPQLTGHTVTLLEFSGRFALGKIR
ncbi:MAG: hypothetical protein QM730_28930 [Anaerolineales bacterium]